MKVLFMGTPDFAVPVLKGLIDSKEHQVVCVVTQPDKARGRSGKLTFSPVKEVAVEAEIPVFQPVRIKEAESVEYLKTLDFDVAVVVAFGQILSKEILDMPRYGCINVHGSLLPRWRGAAPIQWSILAGDKTTGITTMFMDEGLDTGDILLTKEFAIGEKETGGELFDRMAGMGSDILLETLAKVEAGTIERVKQNDEDSVYAKMLTKELGHLDFTKKAVEVERYVRGLNPWPSAYTRFHNKTVKIWECEVAPDLEGRKPGEIGGISKDSFCIQTKDGSVKIQSLQMEGKKRMSCGDFLRGVHLEEGVMCQ